MAAEGGSLVSDILKKAATFDDVYLEETISKVEKRSNDLKEEIAQFLKQNYDEFMVQVNNTITIDQKVTEVTKEFRRLNNKVETSLKERLVKGAGKKEELEKQLNDTEAKIRYVEKLVKVQKKIEQIKVDLANDLSMKQYLEVSKAIQETTVLVNLISEGGCDAKVFYALKNQLAVLKSDLQCDLREQWNSFIKWKPSIPTQELNLTSALSIRHTIPNGVVPKFIDLNESMFYIFEEAERENRVKKYAEKLLDAFIRPLLKHPSLEITISDEEEEKGSLLRTLCVRDLGQSTRSLESCVNSIITLITSVIGMIPESQRAWFGNVLGQSIEPDFTLLFLKHVLSECIPKPESLDTEDFAKTSLLVTSLQDQLKEMNIFSESYCGLTDYISNVDTHIAHSECQAVLQQARDILLRPLHDTVKTTKSDTLVTPLKKLSVGGTFIAGEKQLRLTGSADELDISQLTVAFPTCLVSESIQQLVELLHNTLVRCMSAPDNLALQLYQTSRDMVDLFIAISQAYHSDSVQQLPLNATVQHNNYMYVAHNLLTIGHRFQTCVKCIGKISFIDYVPQLRKLGEDCFLAEMERQSNSILECLESFTTFDEVADRQSELERVIKQAILLIYNLSKVYSETLHHELFRRSQGGLLNVLVSELISRTLSLTDIPSADANALAEVFEAEVILKSPVALSLLSDEDEDRLPLICQTWDRLKELIFVLSASQNDIVSRWANGKGTLAKQFTVTEVKQLVRAIFRNTERRAETLSKIV